MSQVDVHIVAFEGPTEEAVGRLAQDFGFSQDAARALVRSLPGVARRGADREEAERCRQVLQEVGAVVELHPSSPGSSFMDESTVDFPTYPSGRGRTSISLAARVPKAPPLPAEAHALLHNLQMADEAARASERIRLRQQRGLTWGLLLLLTGALGSLYFHLSAP